MRCTSLPKCAPARQGIAKAIPAHIEVLELGGGRERLCKLRSTVLPHVTPMAVEMLQRAASHKQVGQRRARLLSDSIVRQDQRHNFLAHSKRVYNR